MMEQRETEGDAEASSLKLTHTMEMMEQRETDGVAEPSSLKSIHVKSEMLEPTETERGAEPSSLKSIHVKTEMLEPIETEGGAEASNLTLIHAKTEMMERRETEAGEGGAEAKTGLLEPTKTEGGAEALHAKTGMLEPIETEGGADASSLTLIYAKTDMMEQRETEGGAEASSLRSIHVKTENEENSVGEKPAIFTWPSRDIQKGLFMELPKKNVHQDIVMIEVPQGLVQKRNEVAEVVKGAVENRNSEEELVNGDVEMRNSVAEDSVSKKLELIGTGAKVVSVEDSDECRRILNDAGWNVSQNLRKNGRVQWYYRSPDGCLLGSLSSAMGKWRQLKEAKDNNCGVHNENPLAKMSKSGSRRSPKNFLKRNLGFASPKHRTEGSGQRMEQSTAGHDNGNMNFLSGTREGTTRDPSFPGRNAVHKDSAALNSALKPGGAAGTYDSTDADSITKRNVTETVQFILDVGLGWNQLKRRKIQGSSSSSTTKLSCPSCMSSGVPFEGVGVPLSGVVSPMQNSSTLESRPQVEPAAKIKEDCSLGREAYVGNAVDEKTSYTAARIAPQPNSLVNGAFTRPQANSTKPKAWTDHSGDDKNVPKRARVLPHPRSSDSSPLQQGKSLEGSSPFYPSCSPENRPLDFVVSFGAVKDERREDQREAMDITPQNPNLAQISLERTDKGGATSKFLDRSFLFGVLDDDDCRGVLNDAGWNVSQNVRKTGKTQWYYRSPDGCLLGSLGSAMVKWRKMQDEQDSGVHNGNSIQKYGHETEPKSARVRQKKIIPKVDIQVGPIVTTSGRDLTQRDPEKDHMEHVNGVGPIATTSGRDLIQRDPEKDHMEHVNGDTILMLEVAKGTHDTSSTRVVEDRDVSSTSNVIETDCIQKRQDLDSIDQSESSIASMCREGPMQREMDSVDTEVPPMQVSTLVEYKDIQFEKVVDDTNVEELNVSIQETSGGSSEDRNTTCTEDIKLGLQSQLVNTQSAIVSLCQSTV